MYKKQLGSEDLNMGAYFIQKDLLEPVLNGLKCKKCKKNTIIEFFVYESDLIDYKIQACCKEFKGMIENQLV